MAAGGGIVRSAPDFLDRLELIPPGAGSATMRAALLVTPVGGEVRAEASPDNRYVADGAVIDATRAFAQQQELARRIRACGVPVLLLPGLPGQPDGVFPNNAFATVPGRLVLGSMRHPSRRDEPRRPDLRRLFEELFGYRVVDLGEEGVVAEMTGPLVIDRARGVGFCGMSERVDAAGVEAMHRALGLRLTFRFDLAPGEYHTNLALAVPAGRACVLHPGSFADPEAAEAVAGAFPGAAVVLDDAEKEAFAGNCIAVTPEDLFLSRTAAAALRPATRIALEGLGFRLHDVAVDELEMAGGSLRCLVAEIF